MPTRRRLGLIGGTGLDNFGNAARLHEISTTSVSYTHLTLPTTIELW